MDSNRNVAGFADAKCPEYKERPKHIPGHNPCMGHWDLAQRGYEKPDLRANSKYTNMEAKFDRRFNRKQNETFENPFPLQANDEIYRPI